MLQHNLIVAWRNIHKYLSQNIISVLGLSASLLCFSLCMHFCRYIIGTDKHFENYDRIAEIVYLRPNGELYLFSPLEGKQITEAPMNTLENRCMVISIAQINHHYVDEKSGKQVPVDLKGVETDGTFDRVFGVKVVAGSWKQASSMPNSIVLSESKAQKLFGSAADAVGRSIYTSGRYKTVYTVRAVMADMPQNISFFEIGIDMLKLNDENSPRNMEYGYNWHAYIYGLMPDGVELEDVNRELTNSVQQRITHIVGQERTDETIVATRMGEQAADNISILTTILTTFAVLILSVGLLNFLHFLVGSIVNRTHEYSLRRMFGCRLQNLFGLLFTQTFLLLAATALVCTYATKALIPLIEMPAMFADFLRIDTTLMWWQTAEYIGWLLILCAAICLGVSIFIQRIRIQQGMTGMSNAPRIRRHVGRNLMMGLQFFICWIFVSLTVAFYLQARLSTSTVLGSLSRTEKEQILSIPINSKKTLMRPDEKMVLVKRLKEHAGVKDVMTADGEMLRSISGDGILTERGNMDTKIDVLIDNFPTNYFSFMNLEVVSGVLPKTQGQIAADTDFAALFDEDILGRVFYEPYSGKPYTVTAIVRSTPRTVGTKGWISHNKYGWLYMCEREWAADPYIGHIYLKCHPGQVEAVREYALEELSKVFAASIDPEINTMMDDIEKDQGPEVALQDIILFFALVSLAITLLGVYSAITLDTERRRREVALRKVHGARFKNILWLFGRRYFYLLVIPAALAFPLVGLILSILKKSYSVFIDLGFLFWAGIFFGIALLVVLTVLWRILQVVHTCPANEIAKG